MTIKEALNIFGDRKLQEELTDDEYKVYMHTLRNSSGTDWNDEA